MVVAQAQPKDDNNGCRDYSAKQEAPAAATAVQYPEQPAQERYWWHRHHPGTAGEER